MNVLSHWKPIVAAVALGFALAITYLVLTEDRYAAEAKLHVVPVPAGDRTFTGFSLPRASEGARAVETVADLVERPAVVDPAAVQLRLDSDDVLDAVTVHADGKSDVVTVRAERDDPLRAAQIANAVADEFVAERSGVFQGELNRTLAQLREELRNVPASEREVPPADALVSRMTALRAFLGERDPTLRIAGNAVARDRVVWPRPLPVLGTALLGSLVLGLGAAAVLAAAGGRSPAPPADDSALAEREATLDERVRSVTERERALVRQAGELTARERELERRAATEAAPPEPPDQGRLRKREAALDERVRSVTERELALARSAGELAVRERELEQRAATQAAQPEPEPELVAPRSVPSGGAWNGVTLERLVEERGSEFPDRVEEWRAYLFLLREHASMEGALPPSFDALVEDAFRELVG
jgi:capsular polysaccharide biosynthesis protein